MNLKTMLNQSRQSFSEFWSVRNARERAMLAAAAAVVVCALIYALLIDPAMNGREQLTKNLPELRQQAAQLQAMSAEAAALSAKSGPPMAAISKEGIDAALARKGLKAQSVVLAGDTVKVQLASASFAGMLGWLDDMQQTSGISVTEANIVALAQADTVDATLTLRQPRSE